MLILCFLSEILKMICPEDKSTSISGSWIEFSEMMGFLHTKAFVALPSLQIQKIFGTKVLLEPIRPSTKTLKTVDFCPGALYTYIFLLYFQNSNL